MSKLMADVGSVSAFTWLMAQRSEPELPSSRVLVTVNVVGTVRASSDSRRMRARSERASRGVMADSGEKSLRSNGARSLAGGRLLCRGSRADPADLLPGVGGIECPGVNPAAGR